MNTDYLNKENYCSSGLSGLPLHFCVALKKPLFSPSLCCWPAGKLCSLILGGSGWGRAPPESLLAGSRLFQKAREWKYRIHYPKALFVACENICFSSLFASGDVKRMFSQATLFTATFTKPRFSQLPYKLCRGTQRPFSGK